METETGIPAALTLRIVESLKGADHLGSLLKVGESIDKAIEQHEHAAGLLRSLPSQGDLWEGFAQETEMVSRDQAKASLHQRLSEFLTKHSGADDLGLRLLGEQLAVGVRFLQIAREGQYHLVTGNPPYQNVGKAADFKYLEKNYPEGKADLYAAFLLRATELTCRGGIAGLLTLRGWMFLGTFEKLRKRLLESHQLILLGDLDRGGFEMVLDEVVSVVISLFQVGSPSQAPAVAQLPTPREDTARDVRRTHRKHAALLAGVGRYEFTPEHLSVIPGHPLIYWWDEGFLKEFRRDPKLGEVSEVREGLTTGDDVRFLRYFWEVENIDIF